MDYTIDYNTWVCGCKREPDPELRVGKGPSSMLNSEKFMCCLGHFALNKGVTPEFLRYYSSPRGVAVKLGKPYDPVFVLQVEPGYMKDTELADTLMGINDSPGVLIEDRIKGIRGALEDEGHTLTVLNLPPELQHLEKKE
jgi:hypothetical protein